MSDITEITKNIKAAERLVSKLEGYRDLINGERVFPASYLHGLAEARRDFLKEIKTLVTVIGEKQHDDSVWVNVEVLIQNLEKLCKRK